MILAYRLGDYDGDAFFFEDRASSIFCPICGSLLDKSFLPKGVKPRKKYDVCSTYDNRTIVNDRFRLWCEAQCPDGVTFGQIGDEPPYYTFEPTRILQFDSARAGTRFLSKCRSCGNYESVIGTTPPGLLGISEPIVDGFFRTDLEFGSRWEKSPAIILGTRTMALMKQEKFRLIDFDPIYA